MRPGKQQVSAHLRLEDAGCGESGATRIDELALFAPGRRGDEGDGNRRRAVAAWKKCWMHRRIPELAPANTGGGGGEGEGPAAPRYRVNPPLRLTLYCQEPGGGPMRP